MSISRGPLGTTDLTYTHNPDRSGQWAHYLMTLQLQNCHDRMRVNGELNSKVGMVNLGNDLKEDHAQPDKNRKIKVPDDSVKLSSYKKRGYNPRYLYSGT